MGHLFLKRQPGTLAERGDPTSRYRPDVDGLRAIAVSAVVIYHLRNEVLPGGFLGVDMFFVISGYVITKSLSRHGDKTFLSFLINFYVRRIKRLLPALILCVLVTGLLGSMFIEHTSLEYQDSLKAGAAALFGASNIFFYLTSANYFGTLIQYNLFTHTWSLGVEEQFYLIFPTLAWICGGSGGDSKGSHRLLIILIILGGASVVSFGVLAKANQDAAYYMMPMRFWELCAGCIAGLIVDATTRYSASARGRVALGATIVITLGFFISTTFQFEATVAVVLATALLICTSQPGNLPYRLLAASPIVSVGLMSYSIYLWHWSVISLSRWTVGMDWRLAPIQIGLILIISTISYHYVESPLRYRPWSRYRSFTLAYGLLSSIAAVVGLVALYKPMSDVLFRGERAHLIARGPDSLKANKFDDGRLIWSAEDCFLTSDSQIGKTIDLHTCTIPTSSGPASQTFLVIGNSYSAAEFEMYMTLSEKTLGRVAVTSASGASPVANFPNDGKWAKINDYYWNSVVPSLTNQLRAGDVVIMVSDLQELSPVLWTPESEANLREFKTDLLRFISKLQNRQIGVVFQSGNPFIRDAQCGPDSTLPQWFHPASYSPCKFYTREESLSRRSRLQDALTEVQRTSKYFEILDLFPVMCPGLECRIDNGEGTILYRDGWSHTSVEANYLAQPVFRITVEKALSRWRRLSFPSASP